MTEIEKLIEKLIGKVVRCPHAVDCCAICKACPECLHWEQGRAELFRSELRAFALAVRKATLEEAAKIAAAHPHGCTEKWCDACHCEDIAGEIHALIEKKTS